MFFKDKITRSSLVSVALDHGDILLFSGDSQKLFTHGIPPSFSGNSDISSTTEGCMPRISATFRNLRAI